MIGAVERIMVIGKRDIEYIIFRNHKGYNRVVFKFKRFGWFRYHDLGLLSASQRRASHRAWLYRECMLCNIILPIYIILYCQYIANVGTLYS